MVIVGLMITSSVAGIQPFKSTVSVKQKDDRTPINSIVEAVMQPDCLKNFQKVATMKDVSDKNLQAQSKQMEMQTAIVEISEEQTGNVISAQTLFERQDYESKPSHPAIATAGDGNIILGYDYYFENFTSGYILDAQIWDASTTCAAEGFEGDGLFWIHDNEEPFDVSYPSIDYWGINASTGLNQWFGNFVGEEAPYYDATRTNAWGGHWFNGTNVTIMRVVGDPTDNQSYSLRTWTAFGDEYYDMTMADIACCDDVEFPINKTVEPFGICAYVLTTNSTIGPVEQGPFFFKPIEYDPPGAPQEWINRYGLISWYADLYDCKSSSAYLDDVTTNGYAAWDPHCDVAGQDPVVKGRLFVHYGLNFGDYGFHYPDMPEFISGGWTHWLTGDDLSIDDPSIASQDGSLVCVNTIHNTTEDQHWVMFWYDTTHNGDAGENFTISSIWYMTDGSDLLYPEVAHVDGDTFVCTITNNDDLLFAVTYDGGETWDGFYVWSGDTYQVIPRYRCCDISGDDTGNGVITVWEHRIDADVHQLIYDFTTALVEGYAYTEYPDFPAEDYEVWAVNMNFTYPYKRTSSVYTDSDGYYTKNLILGLDIWTNASVDWYAAKDLPAQVGIINEYYNEVTSAGCALYTNDYIDTNIYYHDLPGFPFYLADRDARNENEMAGAAVAQMIYNYLMWNSTENPEGVPIPELDQQQYLYDTFAAGQYITGYEMWNGLNAEIDDRGNGWIYGYFFNPAHNSDLDTVLRHICTWIDFPVDSYNEYREVDVPKLGHPNHVPVAVPFYGDYTNWVAVRGLHTDHNAWDYSGPLNIYGFWVNDPVNDSFYGLGGRTYLPVDTFTGDYFQILNVPGDDYDGEYLAITDPFPGAEDIADNLEINTVTAPAELTRSEARYVKYINSHDVSARAEGIAENLVSQAAFNGVMKVAFDSGFASEFTATQPVEVNGYNVIFQGDNSIFVVELNEDGSLYKFTVY